MNGLHKYTEEVSHAINIFVVGFRRLLCNTCSKLDCNFLISRGQWQQYKVIGKILRCKNKLMQKQTTKTAAPSINSWANFRQVNKKQTFREDNFIFISSQHYLYNTSHISAEDSLWSNIS